MATFTAGTSFTDGVTGDVTAAKLNALVANATPLSNFITDRTAETSIATDDLVLISDTSDSGALNKMTVANLMKAEITGTINSTAGTITTATIPTLTAGTTTGTAATFTSGTITTATIPTLTAGTTTGTAATFTSGTITTGVIPTLTSTTLITSGTGTAASPAIVPTGDTNTGIFFPAADTIAFSEGGTESMRIDSSGRVGIGTSSPSYPMDIVADSNAFALNLRGRSVDNLGYIRFSTNNGATNHAAVGTPALNTLALDTNGTERLRIDSSGNVGIGGSPSTLLNIIKDDRANGAVLRLTNSAESSSWVSGDIIGDIDFFSSDSSGSGVRGRIRSVSEGGATNPNSVAMSFWTYSGGNVSERLRIDSSGNVGIGTTSPATRLHVKTTSAETLRLERDGIAGQISSLSLIDGGGTSCRITSSGGVLTLDTNGSNERLRITSGGEVYIAGTTDQGAYNLQVNGTGVWGAGAYVNGSDERLKENIQDITSGLDVVEKLRPVSFQYKEEYTADRSIQSGFIAQDLLVALEGKNYLEGVVSQGPTYYNVAYQNLIPILAKAIQELKAENDSLKTRIEALEAA